MKNRTLYDDKFDVAILYYYATEKLKTLKKKISNISDMGNQSTALFQGLKDLPTPLDQSQCVQYKHELLVCGGRGKRCCYSYNTLKNEYKFICEYPSDIALNGHCVVKLVDNNKDSNQITLLSFGGSSCIKKHTLVMKYVSVWSNDNNDNEVNKASKSSNYNKWVPFTDNHNYPIIIGRDEDDYVGVRALIGGSKNHLLFITYYPNNISVFDLSTFQFIKGDALPISIYVIFYHCFVSKSESRQGQEMMMKTNKEKNKHNFQMFLFHQQTGLLIKYDEDNNTFRYHKLPVCDDIAPLCKYAYVYVNDVMLFFGGDGNGVSKLVHKYSIRENKWMTFQNTLLSPLYDCVAILSEDNTYAHIIGGLNGEQSSSTHMKTEVNQWLNEEERKNRIELKVEKEKEKKENEIDKIVKKEKDEQQNKMKKDTNVGHAL
ncbi:hypothetical protein RFI_11497 [Reticulomyxa filosa]|uniref:Kelch motif family protein n=1 Tax=Reticulomyxa filosa TaxID=46433 RepID=X6NH45_RETFI|nr:hypothetical protein RFI_11497 [Reticulomyxa filosa]|eukprot:ETO25640.1 hypothetical protein RFI_11497 [Reticulomyxa filosa]